MWPIMKALVDIAIGNKTTFLIVFPRILKDRGIFPFKMQCCRKINQMLFDICLTLGCYSLCRLRHFRPPIGCVFSGFQKYPHKSPDV